jgi:hypothetical protein
MSTCSHERHIVCEACHPEMYKHVQAIGVSHEVRSCIARVSEKRAKQEILSLWCSAWWSVCARRTTFLAPHVILSTQRIMMTERRDFYFDMCTRAQRYGLRPGFATMKFKEQFDDWPPKDWTDALMRVFSNDPGWQARVEYRKKEREYYKEWERDIMPIALARKAAWEEKRKNDPIAALKMPGTDGGIIGVHPSSKKRARPIHAFVLGSGKTSLCGKLLEGWITERKAFTTSTEYGCKKCKEKVAKKNQLALGAMSP